MKKELLKEKSDFRNPRVIIVIILLVLVILALFRFYFVEPLRQETKKYEVGSAEQVQLKLLTEAFLQANDSYKIKKTFLSNHHDISKYGNRFQIAATYYYLLKQNLTEESLNDYDQIKVLADKIYDDEVIFANFVVNIDENNCGTIKYSSLEGIIYSDSCDLNEIVYEIGDIYQQQDDYVVEFYAIKAIQSEIEAQNNCQNFETSLAYKLQLFDFSDNEYYNQDYSRCCNNEACDLEGIFPLKSEILNHTKINNLKYRMIFKKINDNFIYNKIEKL